MTFASTAVSFAGHTSTTSAVREHLHVLSKTKSIARSKSRKPVRQESHDLARTRTAIVGMEAFQEMFVTYRSKFVAIAHAILRNREDAEDAVQNAFLSGYRHLRSFEGRSVLRTWFTRIVLNAALMIQRKRKSSTIQSFPQNSNSRELNFTEIIPASEPDPEMAHARRETLQFIEGVLEKMKPVLRQAFTMTYFDELSGAEACAVLGISVGTFKARLFRARRQLLHQAQRSLETPTCKKTPSAFLPNKNVAQPRGPRPSDTSSLLEALYS
jgi:RNA polymerase sigma-70 factor (ECF subfamily)